MPEDIGIPRWFIGGLPPEYMAAASGLPPLQLTELPAELPARPCANGPPAGTFSTLSTGSANACMPPVSGMDMESDLASRVDTSASMPIAAIAAIPTTVPTTLSNFIGCC